MNSTGRLPPTTLAVIVPVFNEAENLDALHESLGQVLDDLGGGQILFVNDGSGDDSGERLEALADRDPRVGVIHLSRNFGKEIAMTAGLDVVDADAVIIIDADLQDPPEIIPELVERWRGGADVVYASRTARAGESWFKRWTAAAFYRVINRISRTPIPPDTGDFRLLDRRVVEALGQLRERHRFMKGLFSWVGYRQEAVYYQRAPRQGGRSKFDYPRLWHFAVDGITSFTTAPLRLATWLGLAAAGFALVYGVWVIVKTLIWGEMVQGYPSMMVVILFLGGVQLICLGILGEYLGRLFDEAKHRPLYLVDRQRTPGAADPE